jgi:hypothetical protein
MSELDIHNAYKSWRNTIIKDCNACSKTIQSIDNQYEQLFPEHEKYIRQKRKDIMREIRKEYADEICGRKRNRAFSDRERIHGLYNGKVFAGHL